MDIGAHIRRGFLTGLSVIFILLLGVQNLVGRLLKDWLKLPSETAGAWVLLLTIALLTGASAARRADQRSWGTALVGGLLTGGSAALPIALFVGVVSHLIATQVDVRTYLVQLTPQAVGLLTWGLPPIAAALVDLALLVAAAAGGALLAQAAYRYGWREGLPRLVRAAWSRIWSLRPAQELRRYSPASHPVQYSVPYPEKVDRLRLVLRPFLLLPHIAWLALYGLAAAAVQFIAWWAVLFSGRWPRGLFHFVAGFVRYNYQVGGFGLGLCDRYPSFPPQKAADYPLQVKIPYPERAARGHLLVRLFLGWLYLLIPHGVCLFFMGLVTQFMLLYAWVTILVAGRWSRNVFDFVVGWQRWSLRLTAYGSALTEAYPPFDMDARTRRLLLYTAGLFLLLAAPLVLGQYWNYNLGTVGIYVMLGVGLNIVVGLAGLLDLGYVAFFAIGAYTAALLTAPTPHGIYANFWAVVPVGVFLAAVAGVLLGIPVLRMRGDYLAIVTLGFGEIIRILSKSDVLTSFTGGPRGVRAIGGPSLFGLNLHNEFFFLYLILLGIVLVVFLTIRLQNSRVGRAWMAMRDDEDVAKATGIYTLRYKLLAFAVGAAFAGLSGVIFASRNRFTGPEDFTLLVSINVLCLVIVGGMGSIPGVVLGALALKGLPEALRQLEDYRMLAFGTLLVMMMILRPEGLWPSQRRRMELHEPDEGD